MSLMVCPDCRRELSSSARACPQCGRPNKPKSKISFLTGFVGIVGGLFVIGVLASQCDGRRTNSEGSDSQSAIHLKATLTVTRRELRIENSDAFDWDDCDLTLNSKMFGSDYELKHFLVTSNTTVPLALNDFSSTEGERFNPIAQKVKTALLSCRTKTGKGIYGAEFGD